MAHAVDYTPAVPDRTWTEKRALDAEAMQNLGALLAAMEALEEAHKNQVLDWLRGAIGAKSAIFSIVADLGSKPAAVNAVRNVIALATAVGEINPEFLTRASTNLKSTVAIQPKESPAPSLWQLLRRANQPDTRRGMGFLLEIAGAVGRSLE